MVGNDGCDSSNTDNMDNMTFVISVKKIFGPFMQNFGYHIIFFKKFEVKKTVFSPGRMLSSMMCRSIMIMKRFILFVLNFIYTLLIYN